MFTKPMGLFAGLCLVVGACAVTSAPAQDKNAAMGPPKVLVIDSEMVKPGKGGSAHVKAESAFIKALTDAKSEQHYLAADSLTGPPRVLFFFRYDSFAAWEKVRKDEQANATESAAMDQAYAADGELLSGQTTGAFSYREDLSHRPNLEMGKMRYFDISRITVKPGHGAEFEEYMKQQREAILKARPDAVWSTYESQYGWENGGVFLIIAPLKSLGDVDSRIGARDKVREAMGPGGLDKLRGLAGSFMQSSQRNLYAFDPAMSYVYPEWTQSDPAFWGQKGEGK